MATPIPALQTAAVIHEPGPNGTVRIDNAYPVETPGKNQVLVKLKYSGVWYVLDSSLSNEHLIESHLADQKSGHCSAGETTNPSLVTKELALS